MVSPMGNFFTLHVITTRRGASVREGKGERRTKYASYAREQRRSSLIKSRWPNDESSSGSRLEGETGATMGNEGWTETVADGESVVMVAGCGGTGRGQLAGTKNKGDGERERGEGLRRAREISPVSHAMPLMSLAMPRTTGCFYAKMFISPLIFTDENMRELVIRTCDDTRASEMMRQTRGR